MQQPSSQFDWHAGQYSKFIEERTRPAVELISRVPLSSVKNAIDLGCGPGNSTAVIQGRWPGIELAGIDNSDDMLGQARRKYPDIDFKSANIQDWQPKRTYDLIFSNAALHWLPDHHKLLPQLLEHVTPGGAMAIQMPRNHNEITHVAMREVASEGLWSVDLSAIRNVPPVLEAKQYYDILVPGAAAIDIWQTKYFHIMDSVEAIAEWLKGTGLRPFLASLSDSAQERFMERYIEKLRARIPVQKDGKVLLPFPRIFIVATR